MASGGKQPRTFFHVVVSSLFALRACAPCSGPEWMSPSTSAHAGYDDSAPLVVIDPGNALYVYERVLGRPENRRRNYDRPDLAPAAHDGKIDRVSDIGRVDAIGRVGDGTPGFGFSGGGAVSPSVAAARAPSAAPEKEHFSQGRNWKRWREATAGDLYNECGGRQNKWISHCGKNGCSFLNCN